MDEEVRKLLAECYSRAVQILQDNREAMDKVVEYLLQKETITGAEMMAILEGRDPATADSELPEGNTPPASQPPAGFQGDEPPAKKIYIFNSQEGQRETQPPRRTAPAGRTMTSFKNQMHSRRWASLGKSTGGCDRADFRRTAP